MLFGYPSLNGDSLISHWFNDKWSSAAPAPSNTTKRKTPRAWTLVLPPHAVSWYAWPHPNTPKSKRSIAALAQLADVCLQPASQRTTLVQQSGDVVWTGVVSNDYLAPFMALADAPQSIAVLLQPNAPSAMKCQYGSWILNVVPGQECIIAPAHGDLCDDLPVYTEEQLWLGPASRWTWPVQGAKKSKKSRLAPQWSLVTWVALAFTNALIFQALSWKTQSETSAVQSQSRSIVQKSFGVPVVIDPLAQAQKASKSSNRFAQDLLNSLAQSSTPVVPAPANIQVKADTISISWSGPSPKLPSTVPQPESVLQGVHTWRVAP